MTRWMICRKFQFCLDSILKFYNKSDLCEDGGPARGPNRHRESDADA